MSNTPTRRAPFSRIFLPVVLSLIWLLGAGVTARAQAEEEDSAAGARQFSRTRPAEMPADAVRDKPFGVWWRGGQDPARLKELCPYVRGVFVAFRWRQLEPMPGKFDWQYFDGELQRYSQAGLYIQMMVWVGENSPAWVYENGVPRVATTPTMNPHGQMRKGETYPFYLNPKYQEYYWRMLRAVADHLDTLDPATRRRVLALQTAEGNTGDETGYKGEPLNPAYALPDAEWRAFKYKTWNLYQALYSAKKPQIHLLINSGNLAQYNDWILENMPNTWRKAGNPGHGYQLNNEMDIYRFLDPLINHRNRNGEFIRARSEMDELFKGWFREAPVWNQYWLNLWGLNFGLDIQQNETSAFADPRNDAGFEFYDRYGGEKDPATSPGAFCALHDGLDAADTARFPVAEYGEGISLNRNEPTESAQGRTQRIAAAFAKYGAKQGDPENGVRLIMRNRDMRQLNDVGFNIWTDNYQRYLKQYNPTGTSAGYWRVGNSNEPYGRFARGFDHARGKDEMDFILDPAFYGKESGPNASRVRIIYFDQGHGRWALKYDAAKSATATALEVDNKDTGHWKEIVVSLPDARLGKNGPNHSDLSLVNLNGENSIFHLIEVRRGL